MAVMLRMALRTGEQAQVVAADGGVEAAERHVIERVLRVEAQIDAAPLADAEHAAERRVETELRRSGDGIAPGVAPLSGGRKREGREVERLPGRRVVHRQAGGIGAQAAGDAGAGGGGADAADDRASAAEPLPS